MKTHVIYSLKTNEYLTTQMWWSTDFEEAVFFAQLDLAEKVITNNNLSFVEIKTIYI